MLSFVGDPQHSSPTKAHTLSLIEDSRPPPSPTQWMSRSPQSGAKSAPRNGSHNRTWRQNTFCLLIPLTWHDRPLQWAQNRSADFVFSGLYSLLAMKNTDTVGNWHWFQVKEEFCFMRTILIQKTSENNDNDKDFSQIKFYWEMRILIDLKQIVICWKFCDYKKVKACSKLWIP